MESWVLWLLAAVLLAGGEVLTTSLYLAPFAGGALLATAASLLGLGFVPAGIVFVAASLLLLTTLRPIARRHLRTPATLRTGTAALVGRTAVVVDRVDGSAGSVKLAGELWSARPYDGDAVIEPGRHVHVMQISGATALVTPE